MTETIMKPKNFDVDKYENFAQIFHYSTTYHFGTKLLMEAGDRKLTYGQADILTAKLYQWFTDQKLEQGNRVIIISHDDIAVITLFMACLRFGLTAVILSEDASQDELNTLIKAAKPSALFMDADFFAQLTLPGEAGEFVTLKIDPGADHTPPGLLSKMMGSGAKRDPAHFPALLDKIEPAKAPDETPVPLDTVAYILFTSGTTSRPKGVEITHGNLLAQMKTFTRHYGYTTGSRLLNVLPLHHTDGLTQGPVVSFVAGCSVYRPLRFSIDKLMQLLDSVYKFRITHFVAVPSMLQLIDSLDKDAHSAFDSEGFEFIISTAGYLDPNLWERFEKRFGIKIVNVYGLTETVCEALYCGPSEETRKIGTIGKPVDTEARILDDDGKDVKPGETGELALRGPHIMKGYFEMPEETADVLDKEGWFKTGDLCFCDEDGFYHIVGRKKNLIIVGGINIYPDDVANVLRKLPGVLDAAVWGENDETWGEIVVAAIIPESGATPNLDALSEDFLKHASVQMLPRHIHVVDDFPRGPAGKVIIRDLQDMITKQTEQQESDLSESGGSDDVIETVLRIAAHAFKCPVDSLKPESTAETTKGWNSLAHVEFLLGLEKEFKIKIEPRDILSVRSIADAQTIVETKLSKAA